MPDYADETRMPLDQAVLSEALSSANIPTLLMVLVQMTGDLSWLEPPYQPTRNRGLDDNDSGGLPDNLQAKVRAAALSAILDWQRGAPLAIPEPDEALLVRMLSVAMSEHIPDEYGPMIADELHIARNQPRLDAPKPPSDFKFVIIGAGVSGLCAGYQLGRAGADYEIFERHSSVGGTWVENRYPGAGVDTPNHLYSFSFAPHDWSAYFSSQSEIKKYLQKVADDFDISPHIRFNTKVLSAEYNEDRQEWDVTISQANGSVKTVRANVVISAVGAFSSPKMPNIPGLEKFRGPVFHTARWPEQADLRDKNVAVIGNGASAMQTVPAIADEVRSLALFQRSPQWAVPFDKFHKAVPQPVRQLIQALPIYRQWYRLRLGWTFNDRLFDSLQKDPNWLDSDRSLNAQNDAYRRLFSKYMEGELGGRADLMAKTLPGYPPYGKRILLDNGWFRTLTRENVSLSVDRILEIKSDRVVTADGDEYPADVIVLATGFEVVRFLSSFDVIGRGGHNIRDVWDGDDCQAFLGTVIPGFPNFFMLYGPNTQPGHGGSYIFIAEAQVNYVMSVLGQMAERGLASVECSQAICDEYNARIMERHERMIWTHPGMSTYYRNSRGRVVVTIPYRNVDFWHMTRKAELTDYIATPRQESAEARRAVQS
jgi:4-hydroxyacetophenone monooxygenase